MIGSSGTQTSGAALRSSRFTCGHPATETFYLSHLPSAVSTQSHSDAAHARRFIRAKFFQQIDMDRPGIDYTTPFLPSTSP